MEDRDEEVEFEVVCVEEVDVVTEGDDELDGEEDELYTPVESSDCYEKRFERFEMEEEARKETVGLSAREFLEEGRRFKDEDLELGEEIEEEEEVVEEEEEASFTRRLEQQRQSLSDLELELEEEVEERQASSSSREVEPELLESSFKGRNCFPLPDDRIRLEMFKPLKVLGRREANTIFLVHLLGSDNVYTLKQIKKSEMLVRNKVKRIMTERDIYTTTDHPFIVTMYASFQTRKKLYFVMDYCSGGDFYRVLQKQPNKRLSEEAAKFYIAEVILALEYLHVLGFVYRDLKPENILLRSNGHIALTDCDLSKQGESQMPTVVHAPKNIFAKMRSLGSSRGSSQKSKLFDMDIYDVEPRLSRSLSFVGTEEYIAPEVIEGKSQSAAVDWWTVGVLLFEMVCGLTPFYGRDRTETFSKIIHEEIAWPMDATISPECKHLIKRLLQKDPDKRIGKVHGATELKKHRWFKGINFDLIRNESPPIKPKVKDPLDFAQYGPIKDEDLDLNELALSDTDDEDNPFAHFNRKRVYQPRT